MKGTLGIAMQLVSRNVIRTGHPATDDAAVRQAQAQAHAHGCVAQVQPLPQGGFQVEVYRAAGPPAQQGHGSCQACGRQAPTKFVTFHQNIGALIIRFPKTIRGHLCRTCIGKYFQSYTLTSLFLGWWGIISFFYTLVTIPMNIMEWFGARDLPEQ